MKLIKDQCNGAVDRSSWTRFQQLSSRLAQHGVRTNDGDMQVIVRKHRRANSTPAGRTAASGHLLGYAIGSLDLKNIFGTILGDTQFKQLTNICAFSLVAAVGLTSWAVTERVLISDGSALLFMPD